MKRRCRILFLMLALGYLPVHAQAPEGESPGRSQPAAPASNKQKPAYARDAEDKIDKVLKDPEFKHTETVTAFRFKNMNEAESHKTDSSWLIGLIESLIKITQFIAKVAEIVMWALVAVLVFLLIVYRERWLKFFGFLRRPTVEIKPLPQTNTLLPHDELPGDIPGTALKFWQQGEKAAALSILYRGALAGLDHAYRLSLPEGATEAEVLRAVASQQPSLQDYVATLILAWQRLAYAHRPPAQITPLVEGFRKHFESPRS